MVRNRVKVVLDTNIIISAIIFGGKPREILQKALNSEIFVVTSPILLAEFREVISKKFSSFATTTISLLMQEIAENFTILQPEISLRVLKDEPDNRVLEAAVKGKCQFIVTGDKVLLKLKTYNHIQILTADAFLTVFAE